MLQSLGVQGGQRLLDIGCGRGDDVREMAHPVGDSGTVVGHDKPCHDRRSAETV